MHTANGSEQTSGRLLLFLWQHLSSFSHLFRAVMNTVLLLSLTMFTYVCVISIIWPINNFQEIPSAWYHCKGFIISFIMDALLPTPWQVHKCWNNFVSSEWPPSKVKTIKAEKPVSWSLLPLTDPSAANLVSINWQLISGLLNLYVHENKKCWQKWN